MILLSFVHILLYAYWKNSSDSRATPVALMHVASFTWWTNFCKLPWRPHFLWAAPF